MNKVLIVSGLITAVAMGAMAEDKKEIPRKPSPKGAKVYIVQDDVAERGLEGSDLIAGLEPIQRAGIAKLFGDFDNIWHW